MFNKLDCYGRRRSRRFACQRMSFFYLFLYCDWHLKIEAEWTIFSSMAKSGLIALLAFIPILASVLSFVRHFQHNFYFERPFISSIRSPTL